MEKYAKWSITAAVSWFIFFLVLFGGIIPKTAVLREYPCKVLDFHTDPRFECSTKCSVIPEDHYYNLNIDSISIKKDSKIPKGPACSELEKSILEEYNPNWCLNAKYGPVDPFCPSPATCYTGRKIQRKCQLECPLAYNITVFLDVEKLGTMEKSRDLGTDAERFKSYKDAYVIGKKLTCQVIKNGNNDGVAWVDERISRKAFAWWKWSIFTGSVLMVIVSSMMSIIHYMNYRNNMEYSPVSPVIG